MSIAWGVLLAAQVSAPPRPLPTIADPTLVQIGERGRLLYAYDQAAWHGTDDLFAHHRDALPRRGGYIVDGPVERPRLVFFDAATQRATYVAHVADGKVVDAATPTGDDAALSPLDERLIAARQAAVAALKADATARPCAAKPFNTVVVPATGPDGPVSVYFLTPQTNNAAVPMGGHFRVEVSSDGKAGAVQRFTRSCIDAAVNGVPAGGKQVAVFVTQVIGQRPTEIHVFTSLSVRQPVYVGTYASQRGELWVVRGTDISGPRPLPGH